MKSINKIKSYILAQSVTDSNENEVTDPALKIATIVETFEAEYWYEYNRNYYRGNKVKALASWLQGLPSTFTIDFNYCEIEALLKDWGYITEKSRESTVSRELDNYWLNVATVILAMSEENKKAA